MSLPWTKTVSGITTTYTITDQSGSSLALAVQTGVTGNIITSTTQSGNFHQDGMDNLMILMQLVGTGLLP
jgi:hypothetical protein